MRRHDRESFSLAFVLARALERPDEERLHIVERLLDSLDRERVTRAVTNVMFNSTFEQQMALLRDLSGWIKGRLAYMGRPVLEELSTWSESSRMYVISRLARELNPGARLRVFRDLIFEAREKDKILLWEDLCHWIGASIPARKRYACRKHGSDMPIEARLPSSERDQVLLELYPEALEDPGSVFYARKRYHWLVSDLSALSPGFEHKLYNRAEILEIGPGEFAGVGALLAARGANVTMVDVAPILIFENVAYYKRLFKVMDRGGPFDWSRSIGFENERVRLGPALKYLAPVEDGLLPFPEQGFDAIFSAGALEHVQDIESLSSELFRVLKPGGVMWHLLDLSDHRATANHGPLTHLLTPEAEWKKVQSDAGYFQSRRLAHDYLEVLIRAGFEDVRQFVLDRAEITPDIRKKFDEPFKELSDGQLSVTDLLITARKPG
ncbi:MAG: methyltransferase domain-containing protein [Deltaproteobacteria bacterium]|nr:methyltransferase domain-containing protein [Deltaproteobacteria bacterium]